MKKLQNNFTTPEQSKRLLELGVPEDSADFHYIGRIEDCIYYNQGKTISEIQSMSGNNLASPCWSVGRLIEIMLICHIGEAAHIDFDKTIYDVSCISNIDWAIRVLESAIKCSHIDFSKLEE